MRYPIVLSALLATQSAEAGRLQDVRITGISDPEALRNVTLSLSLTASGPDRRSELSDERLAFLLRKAPLEIRTALEPFGYYDSQVTSDVKRQGDLVSVSFAVTLGEPVHVTSRTITMDGAAQGDAAVMALVDRFKPMPGRVFDHQVYEASKQAMSQQLGDRGYFDADLATRQVEVTRATHTAAINVGWSSGARYAFGATTFAPNQLRPDLLDPLLRWKPGTPYDQAKLLDLQQGLTDLDYFAVVDVSPELEHRADGQVPIAISTTSAKRNVYSAGLSYGSDSGAGVQLGFKRRWLNQRGHKFDARAEWAQKLKLVSAQYRIPAFGWLDGWYSLSTNLRDEQTDAGHTQLAEIIAARSGRLSDWNLTAALHAQRERYQDAIFPDFDRYATLVFPSLSAQISHGDDRLYPTHGWGLETELRGGLTTLGSDVSFVQLRAKGTWVHAFGRRDRLLLRGEVGRTFTGNFNGLSPSLRFYAGGDNSVRGYGYQEIGPRVNDRNVGARNLAVLSFEGEHRFTKTWGAAAFVDAGDAFDGSPHARVGIGVGLRWHSRVGPVRIDIAHGLNDPASPLRLHLNIGSDL